MRVLAPWNTQSPIVERSPGLGLVGALAIFAVFVALRVYCAFTLSMNSDEPQHLHVVWAWTQGQVPYRDLFDNHAPLFQLISVPLFAWLGERPDIVALMRLAMLPLYLGALALTWYIARTLWSPRVAWVATVLAASSPIFFIVSIQYRPDNLWMLLWLGVIAAGISPRWVRHRGLVVGFLIGLTLAVSLKTLLLLGTAAVAWLTVPGSRAALGAMSRIRHRNVVVGVLAALVVPAAFAVYFTAIGAWHQAIYCLFTHNLSPDLGHHESGSLRILLPLLGYPVALGLAWWKRPANTDDARWRQRCWLFLFAILYLLVLYGCWPLVTHQDLLPVIPLVAICLAVAILPVDETGTVRPRIALAAAFTAINAVNLATAGVPTRNELMEEQHELAHVLSLTRPGDYVMDAKGESIFRPRPTYWVLEAITETRMREGSIADDITERLAATGTPLVILDRLPGHDVAFIRENYVVVPPASELIYVAGHVLGQARAGVELAFEVGVPTDYAIVTPTGSADGLLDGMPLTGSRRLARGRHEFVPSADSGLAVVWAPALQRGLQGSELFTAIDR